MNFRYDIILKLSPDQRANLIEFFAEIKSLEELGLSADQMQDIRELIMYTPIVKDDSREVIQAQIRVLLAKFSAIQ